MRSGKLLIFGILFIFSFVIAQTEFEVGDVRTGDVDFKVFKMIDNGSINIQGRSAEFDHDYDIIFYGWILNSETREVVWHSLDDSADDEDWEDDGIVRFEKRLHLDKGVYEAYYAGIENSWKINSVGDLLDEIFSSRKKYKRRYNDKLKMSISGDIKIFDSSDHLDNCAKNAIVCITKTGDNESIRKTFSLTEDTRVNIYALGEGRSKEFFDYAWIYDVDRHEKIWSMNYRNTERAGGAKKNVLVNEDITLRSGNYVVNYITDDSHSFDEWNELPPNDPLMYGITIKPVDISDLDNVTEFTETEKLKPVVELIRVRDNEVRSKGIKVEKDVDIRIQCVGEQGYYKDMVDYGWIIDAETKEVVWEMKKRDTEYAGGATKNRMIDEQFTIEKGSYIVYYSTDDSHSYRDWNSSRPYEPERWGITLWVLDENDKNYIETFDPDEYKSENVIEEIVRVRDNHYSHERFTLDKDTKVRIIAIGEGERSRMFDYAWIDDEDGRNVWEMTYRKTVPAGGARKNREFNDTIYLKAGSYKLYYESDGSHSYRDWNDTPPRNPERYGVTLLYEK